MIKKNDLLLFLLIILTSIGLGYWIVDEEYNNYASLVTFLSIMVGFEITSLAILFNSPLKRELWDEKNSIYGTKLHMIKSFYKSSVFFQIFSIMAILLIPNEFCYELMEIHLRIKQLLVFPILSGVIFLFVKTFNELLKIFTFPTNH